MQTEFSSLGKYKCAIISVAADIWTSDMQSLAQSLARGLWNIITRIEDELYKEVVKKTMKKHHLL